MDLIEVNVADLCLNYHFGSATVIVTLDGDYSDPVFRQEAFGRMKGLIPTVISRCKMHAQRNQEVTTWNLICCGVTGAEIGEDVDFGDGKLLAFEKGRDCEFLFLKDGYLLSFDFRAAPDVTSAAA